MGIREVIHNMIGSNLGKMSDKVTSGTYPHVELLIFECRNRLVFTLPAKFGGNIFRLHLYQDQAKCL